MSLFLNKSNPTTPLQDNPPIPPFKKGGKGGFKSGGLRGIINVAANFSLRNLLIFNYVISQAKACGYKRSGYGKIYFCKSLKSQSNPGFTLIEVLVAVAILSIVLAAIYSTFFLSHRAIEGADESMLKLQESRRAIDILRRELDSAFYSGSDGNTFFKIQDRDIYGKQASQLTFTTFSLSRPGLSMISYYIEDKDGKLNLFKKIESPYSKEETEGVDIIEDLEAFIIEAKYNDRWVKTWDTDITKGKPDEIRISLSMMIKGRKVDLFDVSQPRVDRPV